MSEDYCVSCGEIIPEGQQVCKNCQTAPIYQAPCKDCLERHEACHGHCEKYQAFRKWLDGVNVLRKQEEERNRPNRFYIKGRK